MISYGKTKELEHNRESIGRWSVPLLSLHSIRLSPSRIILLSREFVVVTVVDVPLISTKDWYSKPFEKCNDLSQSDYCRFAQLS